jgi:hemerythrin superfamily protein
VNAIDLLKEDHDVVSGLFDQVRNTPPSKHRALFNKIKAELDVHAHIEETVLYPRLKKDGKKDLIDITLEGIEEHRQVKMFLKQLAAMRRGGDEFEAKLQVLMEDVEHHVKEEEDDMFPMVKDQFSDAALEKLGTSLENKKKKFIGSKPDIAKNLVNRRALKKQSTIGAMVGKAVAKVGEMLSGSDGAAGRRSAGKKSGNGKTRAKAAGNGTSTKTAAKSAPAKAATKTAAKSGRSGGRRSTATK